MKRFLICAARIAVILCSQLVLICDGRANNVTFGFTGTVYQVDSPLNSQFAIGNTVQGTYTFNDADVDTSAPNDLGLYQNPFVAANVSFSNGYSATYNSGGSGKLILVDNGGSPDRYSVFIPMSGANVSGYSTEVFNLELDDNQGTMLSSDQLPTTPPSLALAELKDGYLRFGQGQADSWVWFNLTSLSLVPEPSTVSLLLVMAALTHPIRRRHTR
jgi:hypothetical protein